MVAGRDRRVRLAKLLCEQRLAFKPICNGSLSSRESANIPGELEHSGGRAEREHLLRPWVREAAGAHLSKSVGLLAGENGSGKSTILEAIAAAIGFAERGGEPDRLGELPAVPRDVLDEHDVPLLAPVLSATRRITGSAWPQAVHPGCSLADARCSWRSVIAGFWADHDLS